MPLMRVTPLGRSRLYLRRDMIAEDGTAMIEPSCVEAARELGYAEDITEEPAAEAPRRRGRPPKIAAAVETMPPEEPFEGSSDLQAMTVSELRMLAEEKGIELGEGYVKKEELVRMIEEAG